MAVSPPTIVQPFSGSDFTTNVEKQVFTGTSDTGTIQVFVNGSALNVDFNISTGEWSYTSGLLDEGNNIFTFEAWDGISFSAPISQTINYVPSEAIDVTIAPPTAVSFRAFTNSIEILVEQSLATTPGHIPVGYNFYYSQETGDNYVKLNSVPISSPSEIVKHILEETEETLPDETTLQYEQLSGTFVQTSVVKKEVYQEIGRYVFRHTSSSIVPLDPTIPAYYFVTAVYYDSSLNVEVESVPSEELVAQAIVLDTTIRGLPVRDRNTIASEYLTYVFETDPSIDLSPGSIVREIYIEPFANEAEKLYFLIDFYSKASAFDSLVAIDDANGDGFSDPVSSSQYKQRLKIALGFATDEEVQRVIDEAFRKLSGNLNVAKITDQRARGFVTLQMERVTSDIFVTRGALFSTTPDTTNTSQTVFFTSDVSTQLLLSEANNYYNPSTGFFELTIPVTAQNIGLIGNVPAGTITRVVSGVTGSVSSVINETPTRFGANEETNTSLAERSKLAFVGADSGTRGGYIFNTLKINGVTNVKVVGGGDPLMVRDLIPIENNIFSQLRGLPSVKHVWGTVDLYVQGSGVSTITETFSFANPSPTEEAFKVESDVLFQFSSQNESVTSDSPIASVSRVVNFTRGEEYDLTNMVIIGGTVIDLDETLSTNQSIGLCDTDIIRVDYVYRSDQSFVFSNQPVEQVVSIEGELSGDLTENFNLYRNSHPLYEGRSTNAGDYIQLFFENSKPVAELINTVDTLTMIEEYPAPLSRLGAISSTIEVYSLDGLTQYEQNVDYDVLLPSLAEKRTRIRRIDSGSISNGSQVLVSYDHGENIDVTYTFQSVPQRVADEVATFKHITADVLVKATLESPVNIDAIVVKSSTFGTDVVDTNIRSNLTRFFSGLGMGDAVHESDIIAVIDNTTGVDFVLTPLDLLNRSDNTLILDEQLPSVNWSVLSQDITTSYITDEPVLQYLTVDKGGRDVPVNGGNGFERRVVGVRDSFVLYNQVDTEFEVSRSPGTSYVRSDGKLVISTFDGSDPNSKELYATYYTYGETGTRSIFSADNEVLVLGTVNLRVIELAEL